jgi:SPX domain protein involved in polyphosphate accumulation
MKFGKSLSSQIVETLPEWRDKFLSYKDLKKRLKLIGGTDGDERQAKRARVSEDGDEAAAAAPEMTPEEAEFMRLLEAELDKFNSFFVEKEEEYIIRQKVRSLPTHSSPPPIRHLIFLRNISPSPVP